MLYEKADQPFTASLLGRDEATRRALRVFIKPILLSTVLISLTIWGVLGIYWGASSHF